MNEKIPVANSAGAEEIPVIKNLTVDSNQIATVAQKLREYVAEHSKSISDGAVFSAAQALVERAVENKEEIDFDNLPLEEMVNAREQIVTTGAPIINDVTGEVISSANSMDGARKVVRKYNEEKRENI